MLNVVTLYFTKPHMSEHPFYAQHGTDAALCVACGHPAPMRDTGVPNCRLPGCRCEGLACQPRPSQADGMR
jgi:hypothetical protein